MARNQMFKGNVPTGDEWWAAKTLADGDGGEWILFVRGKADDGWINTKLVFDGWRKRKANFWLAYNFEAERFAGTRDSKLLATKDEYSDLRRQFIEAVHELVGLAGAD